MGNDDILHILLSMCGHGYLSSCRIQAAPLVESGGVLPPVQGMGHQLLLNNVDTLFKIDCIEHLELTYVLEKSLHSKCMS